MVAILDADKPERTKREPSTDAEGAIDAMAAILYTDKPEREQIEPSAATTAQ